VSTSSAERLTTAPQPGVVVPAARGAWVWAIAGLVVVGGAAALLHWSAVVAAAATWTGSPTYGYGMLVPPVVAFLLWQRRATLRRLTPRPWPWGLALIAAAALLATVGRVVSALVVEQLALVAILQAAALAILGPVIFRRIVFPMLYLYLAVPLGDGLIAPLQEFTAWSAVGLLDALGVPVRLDGLLIHIPGASFHVAEACAGLRFLLASFALGVLLAELFFRDWWHRVAFVLASIALSIVGNGLRAAGLVLIAHLSDLQLARGVDHLTYGYAFTALLLAALVGLAAMLGTPNRFAADRSAPAQPPVAGAPRGRVLATAAAALLAMALPALAARPAADACRAVQAPAAPEIALPWTPLESPDPWRPDPWRPAAATPDAEIRQGYRSDAGAADLYVAWYCAQREGAEAVSQGHRLGGVVLAQGRDRLGDGAAQIPVRRLQVRVGTQTRLVYLWYWVGGRFAADPLAAKLLQAKAALLGGPDAAAVVVVSAPYDLEPSGARATIEQALAALEPLDRFLMRLESASTP
jgi:exosortase A